MSGRTSNRSYPSRRRPAAAQPSPRARRGVLVDANRRTMARPAGGIRPLELDSSAVSAVGQQWHLGRDSEGLAGSGVADAALQMIDATIIRAHHCAAGGTYGPPRRQVVFAASLKQSAPDVFLVDRVPSHHFAHEAAWTRLIEIEVFGEIERALFISCFLPMRSIQRLKVGM